MAWHVRLLFVKREVGLGSHQSHIKFFTKKGEIFPERTSDKFSELTNQPILIFLLKSHPTLKNTTQHRVTSLTLPSEPDIVHPPALVFLPPPSFDVVLEVGLEAGVEVMV